AAVLGFVAVLQIRAFLRYVDKTNRDLTRLLRSLQYSDVSQTFTADGRGGSVAELSGAFRDVTGPSRAARAEKEEQHRYLQTVMQHIGVGLISFRQDGSVALINNAAKRLLRVPSLKNIQALERLSAEIVDALLRLRAGERAQVKIVDDDELLQLSLNATEFKMRGELIKLVSIQDIQSELEEKEIEAWHKMTRVLTHEIMNSITLISSLASSAKELLVEGESGSNGHVSDEVIADVRDAVRTIEKRSSSLLTFVNAYRSLTRIPQPDFHVVQVADLFSSVQDLMSPQLQAGGIRLDVQVEPSTLTAIADPELVERVLINLVKNAAEALAGRPGARVRMTAGIDRRGRTILQVVDNGPGIVPEAIDKIFVPFFTTKKEGSGIGLSLSREIMRQHGGSLSVNSEAGKRTVFTMRF